MGHDIVFPFFIIDVYKRQFLDSSAVLKNSKGNLDPKYNSGDGLHFNRKAYQALLDVYDKNRLY